MSTEAFSGLQTSLRTGSSPDSFTVSLALKLVMELVTKLDFYGFNPSRPLVLSTISASCSLLTLGWAVTKTRSLLILFGLSLVSLWLLILFVAGVHF